MPELSAMTSAEPDGRIVIRAYDEEENLGTLFREIAETMAGAGVTFEALFVDDGSTDGTAVAIRAVAESDGGVRLLTAGILGVYVGRIFDEVKNRSVAIIADTIGLDLSALTETHAPG
jgi:glycosyltransferase involved in cell wall biosynthesis